MPQMGAHFLRALDVAKNTLLIFLVDVLPAPTRRMILSKEYSGGELERRLSFRIFGGWRMVSLHSQLYSLQAQYMNRV